VRFVATAAKSMKSAVREREFSIAMYLTFSDISSIEEEGPFNVLSVKLQENACLK
jgi:hypothetical protein